MKHILLLTFMILVPTLGFAKPAKDEKKQKTSIAASDCLKVAQDVATRALKDEDEDAALVPLAKGEKPRFMNLQNGGVYALAGKIGGSAGWDVVVVVNNICVEQDVFIQDAVSYPGMAE